jgi:beta-xylosidase
MKSITKLIFAFALINSITAYSQHNPNRWGDLGNGRYRNQILPADYSDPEVLRMGKDYYLISSTFQFSPGIVILHSRDLVNWKTIGSVVKNLPKELNDNRFDWRVMNHYIKGIYAPSLRFHEGKFWCYFTVYNKGGIYMATAKKNRTMESANHEGHERKTAHRN